MRKLWADYIMYYNYVLFCKSKDKFREFYIGYTRDLKKRLHRHENGEIKSTRGFDKVELIYYEVSLNKKDALIREKQLKTGFGRGYIKRRLVNYLKTRV
ncbi:MAG: GIY-YIG nuclease family protein [Patescibacteria group bacterium]